MNKDNIRISKALSTSALAKARGTSGKELFSQLESNGYIHRVEDEWQLLPAGESAGGQYVEHLKYGKYITWPEDLKLGTPEQSPASTEKLVTATVIGKAFGLSANRMNSVLSELGWIEKALQGWTLTPSGRSVGGEQKEDFRSGIPYVAWPESITENKSLKSTINEAQGETQSEEAKPEKGEAPGFREKFEAKLRTTDGHYVRSKAEMRSITDFTWLRSFMHTNVSCR